MNKLLVSDIINLETGEYLLEIDSNKLTINCQGTVKIYLVNANYTELVIDIKDKSTLYIYNFHKYCDTNRVVNIIQNNTSKLYYNENYISNKANDLIVNNYIKGSNNESYINIRNLSNKDLVKIIMNLNIAQDTKNNIAIEDLKGINNGGFIHIEPNIVTLSNEVAANHLTTIGGLNEDNLNYLMSKGIDREKSKEILLKGFILGNMDNYIKDLLGGD